jgi:hypothetical protein
MSSLLCPASVAKLAETETIGSVWLCKGWSCKGWLTLMYRGLLQYNLLLLNLDKLKQKDG